MIWMRLNERLCKALFHALLEKLNLISVCVMQCHVTFTKHCGYRWPCCDMFHRDSQKPCYSAVVLHPLPIRIEIDFFYRLNFAWVASFNQLISLCKTNWNRSSWLKASIVNYELLFSLEEAWSRCCYIVCSYRIHIVTLVHTMYKTGQLWCF